MVKNLSANAGDMGSISGSGRSPGVEDGNPLQYSCPILVLFPIVHGKPHGQRSLGGYSPWGRKEPDTTEHTGTHDLSTSPSSDVLDTPFSQERW